MRMITLQSGSNGNSVFVEAAGVRFLVDAGITGVQMQRRLAAHGIDASEIDALLISHDHSDHVRCAGVYHRKFGIPVYATERTLMATRRRHKLGILDDVRIFRSGDTIEFGPVRIETVPTEHDTADGVGFVFDDSANRLGVLTDLGHAFSGLTDALLSVDAVLLESNYDPDLLAGGPYPERLKRRIRGPRGHLSNDEAAELLHAAFRGNLQWALLGHLSEHNNAPQVALGTHRRALGERAPLAVASRYEVSPAYQL